MRHLFHRLVPFAALLGAAACGGSSGSNNAAPTFDTAGEPLSVVEGERLTWEPEVSDPDGDRVEIEYSGWSTTSSRIAGAVGTFQWTATARDGNGGSASRTIDVEVTADPNENRALFAMSPSATSEAPFPSDVWTVEDGAQATGVRVSLPVPPLGQVTEVLIVSGLNELDGFSPRPRIVVPTTGAEPDANTFDDSSLYVVALDAPERGTVLPVDRRILDPDSGPDGAHRLIASPGRTLRESSRYAIVLTRDLLVGGEPIGRNAEMNELLYRWESGATPASGAEEDLFDALDLLQDDGIAEPESLASLATFTTRTLSHLPVSMRERLTSGAVPLEALDFDVDPALAGDESWTVDELDTIYLYQHRASGVVENGMVSFPEGSLLLSAEIGDDPANVWVENVRNGRRRQVDEESIDEDGGAVVDNLFGLGAVAGDEIALLARSVVFDASDLPNRFESVERIALWKCDIPIYTDDTGEIPIMPTAGGAPPQTDTETVFGILCLPANVPPPGGFPFVNYAHGGGGSAFASPTFVVAGHFAEEGIATLAFNAEGHGGGPWSSLTVTLQGTTDAARVRGPGPGRSRDFDEDGRYGPSEGLNLLQRWNDIMTVVRSAHLGANATAGMQSDLSTDPAETYQLGVSFGGQATFGVATYATEVGVAVANVAGTGQFASGYLTPLGGSREAAAVFLERWEPTSLLNGDHPVYGGGFDEDVPWPGEPVQIGLVDGAEEIQQAFDAQQWLAGHLVAASFLPLAATGEARGGTPMPLLYQIARGDGVSANTLQYHFVVNGELEERTCAVQLDAEPAFDLGWGLLGLDPETARHLVFILPHSGDPSDLASRIPDDLREQAVQFLASGGDTLVDPDPAPPDPYDGDVFEVPIRPETLEAMKSDPGF